VVDWLSISPVAGTTMNFDRSSFGLGDKLAARQWPCNQICVLCNQEQEIGSAPNPTLQLCTFSLAKNADLDTTAGSDADRVFRDH